MKIIPVAQRDRLMMLSKQSGGIPDFVKDALLKSGANPQDVEDADKAGRPTDDEAE